MGILLIKKDSIETNLEKCKLKSVMGRGSRLVKEVKRVER